MDIKKSLIVGLTLFSISTSNSFSMEQKTDLKANNHIYISKSEVEGINDLRKLVLNSENSEHEDMMIYIKNSEKWIHIGNNVDFERNGTQYMGVSFNSGILYDLIEPKSDIVIFHTHPYNSSLNLAESMLLNSEISDLLRRKNREVNPRKILHSELAMPTEVDFHSVMILKQLVDDKYLTSIDYKIVSPSGITEYNYNSSKPIIDDSSCFPKLNLDDLVKIYINSLEPMDYYLKKINSGCFQVKFKTYEN